MIRFAEFDVDPDAGTLRRDGVRVKLQDLPFRLLVVLLRRAGTPVTREELRAELWGAATFVDAEAGLNTAIAKLREALRDNPDAPLFLRAFKVLQKQGRAGNLSRWPGIPSKTIFLAGFRTIRRN